MWCASCQTDVAGEIASDGQSVHCTSCGTEVSTARSLSLHPKTREARELLERWSTEELLEPDTRLPQPHRSTRVTDAATSASVPPSREAAEEETASLANPAESSASPALGLGDAHARPVQRRNMRRKFRLDDQHPAHIGSEAPVPAPHPRRRVEPASQATARLDSAHHQAAPPHFNIASAFDGKSKPGQGESLWGQILAYSGVGLLTVGTVMVLWGYFGGPESYTPTGWLLASAGQMLLFLGVVTLVSGGMEQTTHEVSRRIELLGDQLVRFEKHTQEQVLKGPHFATRDESESRPHQTAEAERGRRGNSSEMR